MGGRWMGSGWMHGRWRKDWWVGERMGYRWLDKREVDER